MSKKILRIQIPKTANISRNLVFTNEFGSIGLPFDTSGKYETWGGDLNPSPWQPERLWNTDREKFKTEILPQWDWSLCANNKVIGWHTPIELYDDIPFEVWKMTWVREPFSILVSGYFFFRGYPQYKGWTFEQYITAPHIINHQTMYVRSVDEYDFVGIYEELNSDFAYLMHILGLSDHKLEHKNAGLKSDERKKVEASDELRRVVQCLYAKDYELYDAAIRRRIDERL